jgi:hypothetical protein
MSYCCIVVARLPSSAATLSALLASLVGQGCSDSHKGSPDAGGDTPVDGVYECQEGLTACGGGCVDLSSSHENCGACGRECEPLEVCSEGACSVECPAGRENCSGSCVNLSNDVLNCGACGRVCPAGINAHPVCERQVCAVVCEAGWIDEDGDGACESTCTPTSEDETCNGVDDNCNGEVDEDFDCAMGRETSCRTPCDSVGRGVCNIACQIPSLADCEPPDETCNGADDDCDGAVDEGFESYRCPLTGTVHDDAASCGEGCRETQACTSAVNPVSASGSVSYAGTCTMRVAPSGSDLNFFQNTYNSDWGCQYMEEPIGTLTLAGVTVTGSVAYAGTCTLRIAASGDTLSFFQNTYNSDWGCQYMEEPIGTLTLAGVTVHACPGGGAFPCAGDPPSCTVTADCETVFLCD